MQVTFISTKPPGATAYEPDPADIVSLELVFEALNKTAKVGVHDVVEVVSLRDIAKRLRAQPLSSGDHIQIVGHGSSGRLALGYFWNGNYADPTQTYALDSNLFYHDILEQGVDPGTTVYILGCSVGDDRLGPLDADGPTLLFDLARMWKCEVSAPVDPVGVADFDKVTGRYTSTGRLVTASSKGRKVSERPPPTQHPSLGEKKVFTVDTVSRMQLLGRFESAQRLQAMTQRLQGFSIKAERIQDQQLLALPELVVRLTNGETMTVLANASVLRVRTSSRDVRYYAPVDEKFRNLIRSTVPQLM